MYKKFRVLLILVLAISLMGMLFINSTASAATDPNEPSRSEAGYQTTFGTDAFGGTWQLGNYWQE